jgi:hypothetical protein
MAEPGAEDLLDSPEMELEKRYVWRVASALKWAFADSESMNVEADRKTLSAGDLRRLLDLLKQRPLQFCLFLSALLGRTADGAADDFGDQEREGGCGTDFRAGELVRRPSRFFP